MQTQKGPGPQGGLNQEPSICDACVEQCTSVLHSVKIKCLKFDKNKSNRTWFLTVPLKKRTSIAFPADPGNLLGCPYLLPAYSAEPKIKGFLG